MVRKLALLLAVVALVSWPAGAGAADQPSLVKCDMTFALKGWSAIYKTASGHGEVTCDNGQKLPIKLTVHGGGLTFGKMDIIKGKGEFSAVKSIDEVLGAFVAAEAVAGAVKSGQAAAYTKGEVSLALAGTGRGVALGFDFGKLEIERAGK